MDGFEKNKIKEFDVELADFPFTCRICLERSDLRLSKTEDYLLDLYLVITKIDVRLRASLPRNVCDDCIKTLEDISLFIDMSKYNAAESGKTLMTINKNEQVESDECGTSQKLVIKSEEYEEDLKYFRGFEICRICYSTNILKPIEEKAHLMQLFQIITNIDIKAEVVSSNRSSICNNCINQLDTISSFISVSLCNEMKLQNTIGRNEALETGNCSEVNAIIIGYQNKVKKDDDFDKDSHSYEIKSLHTIIDIKEENVTPETSIEKINQNGMEQFGEIHSKDEFSTEINLKNLLKGLDPISDVLSRTNRFGCDGSDESFTQKPSLNRHIFVHTEERPFQCVYCRRKFKSKSILQQHMLIHSGEEKPFKCDCCGKSFAHRSNLKQHKIIHSDEKSFKCGSCKKSFTRISKLHMHMLIHSGEEKPFQCGGCKKSFTQNSKLQTHMLIHSGEERPFTCDFCQKSYTCKSVLRRHMLIHSGEKPFRCDCCRKSFAHKSILQDHVLIHAGEKPFVCVCCKKSFTQKKNLKHHMLIHSGEKPFKCDCCEKSFNRKSILHQHVLIHTGEKQFKCGCCEKSFKRKSNLHEHMRIHSEEKPFKMKLL